MFNKPACVTGGDFTMIATGKFLGTFVGLFLLGLVKSLAVFAAAETVIVPMAGDQVQRLEIIVDSNFFKPNRFAVKQNIPVELIFKSAATIVPHNFILRSPEAGLNIEEDIAPGATKVVRFTPTRVGEFDFSCTKKLLFFPSHKDLGMVGTMVVRE
jgi:plastocyanin domain-containing protein